MIKGFYWHVYHDGLLDWCWDYEERVAYVKANKPEREQELRLRLLQPVKGQLPKPFIQAGVACEKAWVAYRKTQIDRVAYDKARAVYDEARATYYEALIKYQPEIEALHAQECPNCPWNGTTILGGER